MCVSCNPRARIVLRFVAFRTILWFGFLLLLLFGLFFPGFLGNLRIRLFFLRGSLRVFLGNNIVQIERYHWPVGTNRSCCQWWCYSTEIRVAVILICPADCRLGVFFPYLGHEAQSQGTRFSSLPPSHKESKRYGQHNSSKYCIHADNKPQVLATIRFKQSSLHDFARIPG